MSVAVVAAKPLPKSLQYELSKPSLDALRTPQGLRDESDKIYHDVLEKHKILDRFTGLAANPPMEVLRKLSDRVCERLRDGGKESIPSMNHGLALVKDVLNVESFNIDNPVRVACECVILSAFTRFVRHPDFITTPAKLLEKYNDFAKERTHWWRVQVAVETAERTQSKWQALLEDVPKLLSFHNALIHAKSLLNKPALKHTVNLASLTTEGGKPYENGNGRSIPSECRHIMVRIECNIPIKPKPPQQKERPSDVDDRRERKKSKSNNKKQQAADELLRRTALQKADPDDPDVTRYGDEDDPPLLIRAGSADWINPAYSHIARERNSRPGESFDPDPFDDHDVRSRRSRGAASGGGGRSSRMQGDDSDADGGEYEDDEEEVGGGRGRKRSRGGSDADVVNILAGLKKTYSAAQLDILSPEKPDIAKLPKPSYPPIMLKDKDGNLVLYQVIDKKNAATASSSDSDSIFPLGPSSSSSSSSSLFSSSSSTSSSSSSSSSSSTAEAPMDVDSSSSIDVLGGFEEEKGGEAFTGPPILSRQSSASWGYIEAKIEVPTLNERQAKSIGAFEQKNTPWGVPETAGLGPPLSTSSSR